MGCPCSSQHQRLLLLALDLRTSKRLRRQSPCWELKAHVDLLENYKVIDHEPIADRLTTGPLLQQQLDRKQLHLCHTWLRCWDKQRVHFLFPNRPLKHLRCRTWWKKSARSGPFVSCLQEPTKTHELTPRTHQQSAPPLQRSAPGSSMASAKSPEQTHRSPPTLRLSHGHTLRATWWRVRSNRTWNGWDNLRSLTKPERQPSKNVPDHAAMKRSYEHMQDIHMHLAAVES